MRRQAARWLIVGCLGAWLTATLVAPFALAQDPGAEHDVTEGPRVYVGLFLHDLTRLDLKNGTFEVDFEMWAKWRGDLELEELLIANAANVDKRLLREEHDGDWHSVRWRVRGLLRGQFPLQTFPYDTQAIDVTFELPERRGTLVPDLAGSGVAESFSLTDWLYSPEFKPVRTTQTFASDLGAIEGEGVATVVDRVSFRVELERPIVTVGLKLFLPLAIICLVAFIALFLDPELITPRASIGVTALLSCFAFQFTVAETVPNVSYLTLSDLLFLLAYFVSTFCLFMSVLANGLLRRGKERAAIWVHRIAIGVVPLLLLGGILWSRPPPETQAAPAQIARVGAHTSSPESARDVLRIGTTSMPAIVGSIVWSAASWSLLEEKAGQPPEAFVAERVPGIDNGDLRFLASGELEVTWRIREGVVWSDGAPLVAADLKLPYEASPSDDIASVETPDDRTLILRWRDRLRAALDAPLPYASHVLGPVFEEGGYDAVREYRRQRPTPTLGPYRVLEFEKNGRLVAEANPHFIGPAPAISRIEVTHFADRPSLVAAIRAGDVDFTQTNSITLAQATELRAEVEGVHAGPSPVGVYLLPDLAYAPLADRDVRRALLMALDREALARRIYEGSGAPMQALVAGELPAGFQETPHDASAARAVFERVGLSSIPILHGRSPVSRATAEVIAEHLAQAGVTGELQEIASSSRALRSGEWGGLMIHPMMGNPRSSTRKYWAVPQREGEFDEAFRSDPYTDDVHALVRHELRALYPERSAQLREQLIAKASENLPILPLVYAAQRVYAHPELRAWRHDPTANQGEGMERWYFAEPGDSPD